MPAFNIYDRANFLHRTFRWLGMQKPVAWAFSHLLPPLDRTMYRITGGRHMATTILAGLPMIELTTIGAKSGQPHNALLALQDGTSYVVIASSFGKPNHPAWYHNLRANAQVTVRRGQQTAAYMARTAEGDERARYWELANQVYPGYNLYVQRAGGRVIPVVVLEPIHDGLQGEWMTDNEKAGESLKEAMVAYRTRWELVAEVEAEELRAMPMERRLRQYAILIAMARAMGTYDDSVQYNEADVQPVRERWRVLKEMFR